MIISCDNKSDNPTVATKSAVTSRAKGEGSLDFGCKKGG